MLPGIGEAAHQVTANLGNSVESMMLAMKAGQ
jgi:hypothetical protein